MNSARACGCGPTTSTSSWTTSWRPGCGSLKARDEEPAELAGQLWDLSGWADTGRSLLDEMSTATDIPGRFVVAAATVRHLLTDPMLPDELLPAQWPGSALRAAYHDFAKELSERRDMTQLLEAT